MPSGPWSRVASAYRSRTFRRLRLAGAILAVAGVVALMWFGGAKAASAPPDLVTVAREVMRLPPGPGGYGRDCFWRTGQVIARLRGYAARRQDVTWVGRYGAGCHAVASVWIGEDEWMVDGQSGIVAQARGEWAGPFHIDNCEQVMRR